MKKWINMVMAFYKKHEEVINYLIIGGLTTVISLVVKYALLFTVLSAQDAVQLQIAIVISWIVAVVFAYITNRKFVFKSKNKNIQNEVIKFFGARITTLLMEAAIMWFFVTFLQMNSKIEVIVWTMVTQVLIIIGNYILSKIFVFRKEK